MGLFAFIVLALSACSTNTARLNQVQPLDKSAQAPYNKVLVVGLFNSFETRSLLERAVVQDIGRGIPGAVAATSFMKTTTPITTESILAVVKESGADAVLVTQLVDFSESRTKIKDRNPEASYKVRPTYYWNVWEVRLTEYMEPQYLETKVSLLLLTELYQVNNRKLVWAVESKAKITKDLSRPGYYPFVNSQATTIAQLMQSKGIIARTATKP